MRRDRRGERPGGSDGAPLTAAGLGIFAALVAEESPDADRTYKGDTDAFDYLDFMAEWEEPG